MRRERDAIWIPSGLNEVCPGHQIRGGDHGPTSCLLRGEAIASVKAVEAAQPPSAGLLADDRSSRAGGPTRLAANLRRWIGLIAVCLLASVGSSWAVDAPPLDLNRATETELAALPGIGKVRAQAIARRRAELRFVRPEELLGVPGIGPSIYAGLRDRIEVRPEADPVEK